jgi:hypothetical protein
VEVLDGDDECGAVQIGVSGLLVVSLGEWLARSLGGG